MKREAERKRLVLLENYQMQNSWLTWGLSDMMRKDLTWNKILTGYSEKLLKFVLNANLLTLATPDNLRRWKIASDVPCGLCSKPNVGLSHVLAGCPWVLKVENKLDREDRNTWRHNCVLLALTGFIQKKVKVVNAAPIVTQRRFISFVRAGHKPGPRSAAVNTGILFEARDWICDFDLPELHPNGSIYSMPSDIDITGIRCDGYVISRSSKICILFELTVPMEENMEFWHQKKLEKYANSLATVVNWKFHFIILEVGCRGFIAQRFSSSLRRLGFTPRECRCMYDAAQLLARKSSYVIWLNRYNKDFKPFRLTADISVDQPLVPNSSSSMVGAPPS